MTLFTSTTCKARISLNLSGDKPVVQDNADLLSNYEEITIIDKATELYEKTGFVYIFITYKIFSKNTKQQKKTVIKTY